MNLKEIKEMIALMNEHNLAELQLEREGLKISLKRGGFAGGVAPAGLTVERVALPESGMYQQVPSKPADSAPAAVAEAKNVVPVKSPMVGTFYRAPSPEAAAFVEVGSDVEIGQVLCIIEAMKLMNEIKSEVKGRVKEILIENADPIEFGQVLFKIEKK